MKSIILKLGEMLIGVAVFFGILAGVISAFPYFKYGQTATGVGVIIVALLAVVISSFLIYLLIDIRDKIAENNLLLRSSSNE